MQFANKEIAQKVVEKIYPDATQVSFVDHGYDNLVVLVDEQYALRFPRNEQAYARTQYEKEILLKLSTLNVTEIPTILGEGVDPPYLITQFIQGKHLREAEINAFPLEQQKVIGRRVAAFAYALHSLLSVSEVEGLRKEYHLDNLEEEPWRTDLEKKLLHTTLPNPIQDKFAKKFFHLWEEKAYKPSTVVVHDDLHTDNLLFEEEELIGVLDFGDTNTGTPEQELRQLYRINETVLLSAAEEYERLSGTPVDVEVSKIWSITQELAIYSERLSFGDLNHPSYLRTATNLNKLLPEGKWGSSF